MMRSSEDAVKVGESIQTAVQEIRLVAMREQYIHLTNFFLENNDFDRAMYFAVQAQFCREALENIVRQNVTCEPWPLTRYY